MKQKMRLKLRGSPLLPMEVGLEPGMLVPVESVSEPDKSATGSDTSESALPANLGLENDMPVRSEDEISDYDENDIDEPQRSPSPPPADSLVRETRTRQQPRVDYKALASPGRGFAVRVSAATINLSLGVPANVDEALSSPNKEKWKTAFEDELNSPQANNTWESPAPIPKGRNMLPRRQILTHKIDAKGRIVHYKARQVLISEKGSLIRGLWTGTLKKIFN